MKKLVENHYPFVYGTILCFLMFSCTDIDWTPGNKPLSQSPTPNSPIQVNYTMEVRGNTLHINNRSTGAQTYSWDFGDGQTYTGQNPPDHSYSDFGRYQVKMTAKLDNLQESRSNEVKVQWKARDPFPGPGRLGGKSVEYQGNHYYGFGGQGSISHNDWWKYDYLYDSWEKLSDCPIKGIKSMILLGDQIYAFKMNIFRNQLDYVVYDFRKKSWTKVNSISSPTNIGRDYVLTGSSFLYDGNMYLISRKIINDQVELQVWEFDTQLNTLSQKSSWEPPTQYLAYTDGIFDGEKFYMIGSRYTFIYQAQNNSWSTQAGFRPDVKPRYGFSVSPLDEDNMLVIGGGDVPPLIRTLGIQTPYSNFSGEYSLSQAKSSEIPSAAPYIVNQASLLNLAEGAILLGGNTSQAHDTEVWEFRKF